MPRIRPDDKVRKGSVKDTRRWCRGRVGVARAVEWVNYFEMKHGAGSSPEFKWQCEVCSTCGRKLRSRRIDGAIGTAK